MVVLTNSVIARENGIEFGLVFLGMRVSREARLPWHAHTRWVRIIDLEFVNERAKIVDVGEIVELESRILWAERVIHQNVNSKRITVPEIEERRWRIIQTHFLHELLRFVVAISLRCHDARSIQQLSDQFIKLIIINSRFLSFLINRSKRKTRNKKDCIK